MGSSDIPMYLLLDEAPCAFFEGDENLPQNPQMQPQHHHHGEWHEIHGEFLYVGPLHNAQALAAQILGAHDQMIQEALGNL